MNRNYGYLNDGGVIVYADDFAEIDGVIYTAPKAEHYAAMTPPRLPIVSEQPTGKVGVYYTPTERGELRDGTIYRVYEEHPIVAPVIVKKYSKLKLITAAKAAGKWDALKAWIAASGYADEWAACMYLADDYAGFEQIKAALVASGIVTAEEVEAILAAAEDDTLRMEA